jgi:hypothetical protein
MNGGTDTHDTPGDTRGRREHAAVAGSTVVLMNMDEILGNIVAGCAVAAFVALIAWFGTERSPTGAKLFQLSSDKSCSHKRRNARDATNP